MIKTNLDSLVEIAVCGHVSHPVPISKSLTFTTGYDGKPFIPIGFGGIVYNVKVGDRALNWAWGDHLEPGVSIRNQDVSANQALYTLSCVGNEAVVTQATMEGKEDKIKGSTGTVTGKTPCSDRVIIHFSKKVLDRLCIGDLIQIKACGQGLKLLEYSNITLINCSPQLFKTINPSEKSGRVRVPVTTIIPGKLMGSGIGSLNSLSLGCDIQSTSQELIKEYKLENIRLGDLIAIADYDCTYGARWQAGAITVGVIVHGASSIPAHGPGICALFTSPEGLIEPVITRRANIGELLNLT